MKIQVKCYKCGKVIYVHDYSSTDICPECMSFIDIETAKKALEADASAPQEEKASEEKADVKAPFEEKREEEKESPPEAKRGIEEKAQETFGQTEVVAPGAAEDNKSREKPAWADEEPYWWSRWQKVLENTQDFADFSRFEDVREDAEYVVSEMSESEGYELFLEHYEKLEQTKQKLEHRLEAAAPVKSAEKSKIPGGLLSVWALCVFAIFFMIVFTIDDFSGNISDFIFIPIVFVMALIITVLTKVASAKVNKKQKTESSNPFNEDFHEASSVRESFLSAQERENLEEQINAIEWLYYELETAYESVNDDI